MHMFHPPSQPMSFVSTFNPFIFKIIIDMYELITILLIFLCLFCVGLLLVLCFLKEATYIKRESQSVRFLNKVSYKIGLTTLNSSMTSLEAKAFSQQTQAGWLHQDVLDVQYVPCIRSLWHLDKDSFYDIHIIVSRTEQQVKTIAVAGTMNMLLALKLLRD